MTNLNYKVMVASSLNGKDLWLLKKFLENNNNYGNIEFEYNESSSSCCGFITKTQINKKVNYSILLQTINKSLPILPVLSIKSLKSLFSYLSKPESIEKFKLKSTTQCKINSTNNIFDFLFSNYDNCMKIIHNDFHLIINPASNTVYSNSEFLDDLFIKLKSIKFSELKFDYSNHETSPEFKFKLKLSDFYWKLGILFHENLLSDKHKSSDYLFKQIAWPDFGRLPYHQDFIQLCSMLSTKPRSYEYLLNSSGAHKNTIHQFLNSSRLAGKIVLIQNTRSNDVATHNKLKHFSSLKSFFRKLLNV